ncbi:hypothetical protein LINGRAHAP2_LOCUS20011 [Linum grandiflorum]
MKISNNKTKKKNKG